MKGFLTYKPLHKLKTNTGEIQDGGRGGGCYIPPPPPGSDWNYN